MPEKLGKGRCDLKAPVRDFPWKLKVMATQIPGDDTPLTTRSNEELLDKTQQWNLDNPEREIVVVVGGKSGTGKSTLINNFLSLGGNEAAEARIQPTSVTHNVKVYQGEVSQSGVRVRAVDMPGLHARRHSSDMEKEVITALSHHTEGKADILIYCISLTQRLDSIDEKNIATLNKAFGEKLWANAILVLTHADTILEDEDNADRLDDIVEEFAKEFEEILADCADIKACAKPFSFSDPDPSPATEVAPDPSPVTEATPDPSPATEAAPDPSPVTETAPDPTQATEATPDPTQVTEAVPETAEAVPGSSIATEHEHGDAATTEEADSEAKESPLEIVVIPTGKKQDKPPGWKDSLLAQVITICQKKTISYLTKLEGVSWEKIVKKLKKGAKVAGAAGAIGGASGAAVGTGIGATVGGVIGGILTAPFGGFGAAPTAAGGAAMGALLGSLFGGGGTGVVALLAGGLATAHNENLFKDITFYYQVQKKLEELQKKKQDELSD